MWSTLILFAQAAQTSPPTRIDLLAPTVQTNCRPDAIDEVVVCGGRDNPYRLRPLPPLADAPTIPKAQTGIGNAQAAIESEQAGVGGFPSNRVMLRLKMPF